MIKKGDKVIVKKLGNKVYKVVDYLGTIYAIVPDNEFSSEELMFFFERDLELSINNYNFTSKKIVSPLILIPYDTKRSNRLSNQSKLFKVERSRVSFYRKTV